MKCNLFSLIWICIFLGSCSGDERDDGPVGGLPIIALVNWTGHWDAICSPGEPLTFSITHKEKNQRFEIEADSGASFETDLKEGDLIRIAIINKNGDVILSRSKNFNPSNPETPSRGLDMTPFITVCQIDRLDISGF